MKFEELEQKIGVGAAVAIYYSDSKRDLPSGLKFSELADAYKEAPEGSKLKKDIERNIMNRARHKNSFSKWFQIYQACTDNPGLQRRILKKMIKNAKDFNQWMDIYVELEAGEKMKPEIEKIMLDVADDLEELFTLYYVICEESNLAVAVAQKISGQKAPIEKWVEIYERIPRKKEFSMIKDIFLKKMSELLEE